MACPTPEPRLRRLKDFGGPGNDSLSFVPSSLGCAAAESQAQGSSALAALRGALEAVAVSRSPPRALQLGCVPEELAEEAGRLVEGLLPGQRFVRAVARGRRFVAPAAPHGPAEAAEGVADAPEGIAGAEAVEGEGHELAPWLSEALQRAHYPPDYVRVLLSSDAVAAPLVARTASGDPVAHVVQEASDLSVGALFVEEPWRRKGVGAWLLAAANRAVLAKHGEPAVSLVEEGNEAAARTHVRAGWRREGGALVWLAFMETPGAAGPPPQPAADGGAVPPFAAWVAERLAAGASARSVVGHIHEEGVHDLSEEDARRRLEAFAHDSHVRLRACELVRVIARKAGRAPPIPFSAWLEERRMDGAAAGHVLNLLGVSRQQLGAAGDADLWSGLRQFSERDAEAWETIRRIVDSGSKVGPQFFLQRAQPSSAAEVAGHVARAQRILVLVGAGISASCGIPTFRDSGGLYERVGAEFGMSTPEEVNDIGFFRAYPEVWFRTVRDMVPCSARLRRPSLTHRFIKALQDSGKLLHLYTQNVDTLEAAAGITDCTHCHGSFASATCTGCRRRLEDATAVNDAIAAGEVPRCESCGEVMKPDVVLFNEPMPSDFHDGLEGHTEEADLLLVMGTSLKVAPCSLVPRLVKVSGDAPRILLNAERVGTDDDFDGFVQGACDETVGGLLWHLRWELGSPEAPRSLFVYGSLRPDDNSGMPWTKRMRKGLCAEPAIIRRARLFEDTYACVVLGKGAAVGRFAAEEDEHADDRIGEGDVVEGYLLSAEEDASSAAATEEARAAVFAHKLAEADRIEGFPALYRRAAVDAQPLGGGPPVRAWVYHRPGCSRALPVASGNWLDRR